MLQLLRLASRRPFHGGISRGGLPARGAFQLSQALYTSSVGYVRCQHECGYLLAKGNPAKPQQPLGDVIDWIENTGNRLHPTQKPISVLLPLIETYSSAQETVLDPFAGSGSTLLAARMLGRKWLGVELDGKYHASAMKRLAESGTQP